MPNDLRGHVLKPGDPAPDVVLDAITQQGQIAVSDFRGRKPLLIGLFRGLHCPFCRRHLAMQAQIDKALREKGVESVAVVVTPIDRARLFFRYHPIPNLLAAADPERASHRAFGLRTLESSEMGTEWQRRIGVVASAAINAWDRYKVTEADKQMAREASGQLFGQFLIDREGIIRWSFNEAPDDGTPMFARPSPEKLLETAWQIAG